MSVKRLISFSPPSSHVLTCMGSVSKHEDPRLNVIVQIVIASLAMTLAEKAKLASQRAEFRQLVLDGIPTSGIPLASIAPYLNIRTLVNLTLTCNEFRRVFEQPFTHVRDLYFQLEPYITLSSVGNKSITSDSYDQKIGVFAFNPYLRKSGRKLIPISTLNKLDSQQLNSIRTTGSIYAITLPIFELTGIRTLPDLKNLITHLPLGMAEKITGLDFYQFEQLGADASSELNEISQICPQLMKVQFYDQDQTLLDEIQGDMRNVQIRLSLSN